MDRLSGGDLCTGGLDDQIHTGTTGQFLCFCDHILFCSVDHSGCTQFQGFFQTFFHDIYHINFRYAAGFQRHHGNQTDTSGTHHHCFLSQMGVSLDRCVETDSQRFDQRALQCTYIFREFEAEIRLMRNILLKDTVYRRRCEKYDIRTEVVFALFAEFAVSASFSRLQSYFITDFQVFDIFSHFHNNATRLMTENKRRFYDIIADGSTLIIMQIRSADSHIIQLYQNFIVLRRRDVTLRKSHLADTVHHCYFHLTFHVKCPPYIRFSKLNKIVLLSFLKDNSFAKKCQS